MIILCNLNYTHDIYINTQTMSEYDYSTLLCLIFTKRHKPVSYVNILATVAGARLNWMARFWKLASGNRFPLPSHCAYTVRFKYIYRSRTSLWLISRMTGEQTCLKAESIIARMRSKLKPSRAVKLRTCKHGVAFKWCNIHVHYPPMYT